MFILKKGHQPGVYVPLRALFLVLFSFQFNFFLFIVYHPPWSERYVFSSPQPQAHR